MPSYGKAGPEKCQGIEREIKRKEKKEKRMEKENKRKENIFKKEPPKI